MLNVRQRTCFWLFRRLKTSWNLLKPCSAKTNIHQNICTSTWNGTPLQIEHKEESNWRTNRPQTENAPSRCTDLGHPGGSFGTCCFGKPTVTFCFMLNVLYWPPTLWARKSPCLLVCGLMLSIRSFKSRLSDLGQYYFLEVIVCKHIVVWKWDQDWHEGTRGSRFHTVELMQRFRHRQSEIHGHRWIQHILATGQNKSRPCTNWKKWPWCIYLPTMRTVWSAGAKPLLLRNLFYREKTNYGVCDAPACSSCHTAVRGEECYDDVKWAMETGGLIQIAWLRWVS